MHKADAMLEHYWTVTTALFPFLWKGFIETLYISLVAIVAGSLIGFVIGVVRSQHVPVLTGLFGLYIHVLRGTPFLVQLYLFYFVLPNSGVSWLSWDSITAAFVALSVYTSSYVAEIVKGAIEAVPRGQSEAAKALGMSRLERLWYVVLPQALKLTVPPMSSVYVMIIKSTAILSVIGISELTRQGEVSILRYPRDVLFIYGLIAAMYFVYCYPVLRFARWAERRVGATRIVDLD
jgi:polar amino acid transport system permease protein